jgi:hypothetical protein
VIIIFAFSGCASKEVVHTVDLEFVKYDTLKTFDIPFDIQESIILISTKDEFDKAFTIKDGRYPDDPNAYYHFNDLERYDDEYFKAYSLVMISWLQRFTYYGKIINLKRDDDTLFVATIPVGSQTIIYVNGIPERRETLRVVDNEYRISILEIYKEDIKNVKSIKEINTGSVAIS